MPFSLEARAGIPIGKGGLDVLLPGPTIDFPSEYGSVVPRFISGLESGRKPHPLPVANGATLP